MPVTLRKRKAPTEPAYTPPAKRKTNPVKATVNKAKAALVGKNSAANGSPVAGKPIVGTSIDLEGFGGEVETNDSQKTTLQKLVDASKAGVVVFTYPKASTPGCTTQVGLFRDSHKELTNTGLSIYGLSRDSPKANSKFKEKQSLPFPLLCDPAGSLIKAIGLQSGSKDKGSGTQRGVFVLDKTGKVLVAQPGSPSVTVEAVRELVKSQGSTQAKADPETSTAPAVHKKTEKIELAAPAPTEVEGEAFIANGESEKKADEVAHAKVAADVADTAAKLDPPTPIPA